MRTHHGMDYIEFPVPDLSEARRFYSEAFGWSFKEYGPAYLGIVVDGKEVGGMCESSEAKSGGLLVVLYSQDLESSQAAVLAAGGQVSKPIFEFPGGRRFHFCDPAGHELAVWTMTEEPGP